MIPPNSSSSKRGWGPRYEMKQLDSFFHAGAGHALEPRRLGNDSVDRPVASAEDHERQTDAEHQQAILKAFAPLLSGTSS